MLYIKLVSLIKILDKKALQGSMDPSQLGARLLMVKCKWP